MNICKMSKLLPYGFLNPKLEVVYFIPKSGTVQGTVSYSTSNVLFVVLSCFKVPVILR